MNNITTQADELIDRCYRALAEGISKQDEDTLLVALEMYTQQRALENKVLSLTDNPQLN